MKSFIVSALLGLAVANPVAQPLEVLSSRPLTEFEERGVYGGHKHCPVNGTLAPGYLAPTLMVPVSKKHPNHAYGATEEPIITPNDFCTIFNLEIPSSAVDKTCTLEFLFPNHKQTPSPYEYHGKGHFTFTGYAIGSGATLKTTYNHQPPPGPSPPAPPAVLAPGHAYTINVGSCAIQEGQESLEVSGMLCSTDTYFHYLQSAAKCPLGFFVEIS